MEAKQMQLQNFFIFIIDCICIVISYVTASYVRFGNLWGGYNKTIVLLRLGILLLSITMIYFIFNPNRSFFQRKNKQEFFSAMKNTLLLGSSVTMVAFLMQDAQDYSRLVYVYFCCIYLLISYICHLSYKRYMNDIFSRGRGTRNIIILTNIDRAEAVCKNIQKNNSWNINIKGLILIDDTGYTEILDVPVVSNYSDMMEYVKKNVVDEIFIHLPSQTDIPFKKVIKELETMGITVNLYINLFEMEISSQREIERIGDYYAVSFSPRIR